MGFNNEELLCYINTYTTLLGCFVLEVYVYQTENGVVYVNTEGVVQYSCIRSIFAPIFLSNSRLNASLS